jgi:ABC-type hemin transport system ATPase subunit
MNRTDVRTIVILTGQIAPKGHLDRQRQRGSAWRLYEFCRVLAIIGPNGAGKTVLFRALLGSIPFAGSAQRAPKKSVADGFSVVPP